MALNFIVSYTYSPNATISSAQVNTNTSDVANVFTGLEGKTKSLSNLVIDATPTASTDAAIKSYVDKLNNYRRPNLVYSTGTVVNIETGINGTSGQAQVLFPDGTLRTDSGATRINLTISQVAVLSGTAQSGIRTGSAAASTSYSVYAVKVTDSSTNFVLVADTVGPTQANYATLNSNFGTNSWVYLGQIWYGDNSGATTAIAKFVQCGNRTHFYNALTTQLANPGRGIRLATTAGAATLTYTYVAGTAAGQIPAHIPIAIYGYAIAGQGGSFGLLGEDAAATGYLFELGGNTNADFRGQVEMFATAGLKVIRNTGSPAADIFLVGYIDQVLGVGANPIL